MQSLEIKSTYKSPRVVFDPSKGNLILEGKSILVNVEEFYAPLLEWMDAFVENPPCQSVKMSFDIEYFNLASTKRFMFLLMKLQDLRNQKVNIEVTWLHASNDKDSKEMGEDLSQMLNLPIELVAYEKTKTKLNHRLN